MWGKKPKLTEHDQHRKEISEVKERLDEVEERADVFALQLEVLERRDDDEA